MGLFDFFSSDQGEANAQMGYNMQNEALEGGKAASLKALRKGLKKTRPYLKDAVDLYSGITDQQQAGYDMYQNALGLRGDEGRESALGAFQQGPGYQFALDQANQNVLRNNAALGGLGSGNTLMALSDRAQQMQNQEWDSWLNRLQGFDPMRGAEGQARSLTNLGNMFTNYGRDVAGVHGNFAPLQAQAGYDYAANVNNAQQAAGANTWGAILGGLSGLGSIFGA